MAEEEKGPLPRLDSLLHARDAAKISVAPKYYGPRQWSLASQDASALAAAIADSVIKTGAPLLPEKVTDANKSRFESLGMSVTEGDMIYRVGDRLMNATTTFSDSGLSFEHVSLPERTGPESQKLAEYMAHHGTSGRKPWSKDEVSFNMVHGRDGDGHKALQKVEELQKKLSELETKYQELEEKHRNHAIDSPAARDQKRAVRAEILAVASEIAEGKATQAEHQKVADEQMMPDAASLRSMLQRKFDDATSELSSISADGVPQPGKEAEFAELTSKRAEVDDLLKLDDASLTALRLYTGPSYSHMNAIGNTDTMRAWTPEQFSDNLLAQTVTMDTINRHSQYGTEDAYYRAESPYARKFEEASAVVGATKEADAAMELAARTGKPEDIAAAEAVTLAERYVSKSTLTSTKEGDYAGGFVYEDTTLTKLSGVKGMKIGELSYWHGEKELLVQPGSYRVSSLEATAHHGADSPVYEQETKGKHDHSHQVVEYEAVGFTGPREDQKVGDSNAARSRRVVIDPSAKVPDPPSSPLASSGSFSSAASTLDIGPVSPTASTASTASAPSSPFAGLPKKGGQLPPMDPAYVAAAHASLPHMPHPTSASEQPLTFKKAGALPPLDPALLAQAASSPPTPAFSSGGHGHGGIKLPPMPATPQGASGFGSTPQPTSSGMGLGGIKLPPLASPPALPTSGLAGLGKAFDAAAPKAPDPAEPAAHKGPKPA